MITEKQATVVEWTIYGLIVIALVLTIISYIKSISNEAKNRRAFMEGIGQFPAGTKFVPETDTPAPAEKPETVPMKEF